MRYITRELYEQIQFTSWIEFELSPQKNFERYNRNDIETILKNEMEERLKVILSLPNEVKKMYKYNNIEKDYKEYINEKVKMLKKYLPEYIKKEVYDYRLLVLNLVSKDLYKKLLKWKSEIELNWKNACDEYNHQYKSIKQQLSEGMKEFSSHTMLDQKILSLNRTSKDKLCIEYKNGTWGKAYLNFEGVKSVEVDGEIEGSSWIYDEVYLACDDNFEYQILLDKSELKIIAKDVYTSFVNNNYVEEALKVKNYSLSFNIMLETIRCKAMTIGKENLLEEEKKLILIDNLICMLKYDSITPKQKKISRGFEQFLTLNSEQVEDVLEVLKDIGENDIFSMLTQAAYIFNCNREKSIKLRALKKIDKNFLNYEKYNKDSLYKSFIDYIKKHLDSFQ